MTLCDDDEMTALIAAVQADDGDDLVHTTRTASR